VFFVISGKGLRRIAFK